MLVSLDKKQINPFSIIVKYIVLDPFEFKSLLKKIIVEYLIYTQQEERTYVSCLIALSLLL